MPTRPHVETPYGYRWRTVTVPRIRRRDGGSFNEDGVYLGFACCVRCGFRDWLKDGRSQLDVAHLVIPWGGPGHDDDSNLACLCHGRCHKQHDYPEWAAKVHETWLTKWDSARPVLVASQEL